LSFYEQYKVQWMYSNTTKEREKNVNYHIVIHVSMTGDLVVVIITCIILGLVIFTKRLHTATNLLFDL